MGIRIVDEASFAAAVASSEGRQLVVAGPGTGKTQFLAHRAAHLVENGVDPDGILLLTFNRRAAGELGARVRAHAGPAAPPTHTFHGFAYGVLTRHGRRLVDTVPRVLTSSEQRDTVRRLLREEDPDVWPAAQRALLGGRGFVADIADFLLRAQENLLSPADVGRLAAVHGIDDWEGVAGFFPRYRAHLAAQGAFDYGGLIGEVVHLLGADADLRRYHATRFTHVLVDEYQDTNRSQAALLRLVTEGCGNLTVVGDPVQSIYRFRGATLENIVAFPDECPDAEVHTLETSRRCPAPVLAAAEALTVTQRAALRDGGLARAVAPAPHDGALTVHVFPQQAAEAEWIARHLATQHARGQVPWRRMAVLVRSLRTRFGTTLRRALERAHVPAALARDPGGGEPPAVRAFLDLVEATLNPDVRDDLVVDLLAGPLVHLPVTSGRALLRDAARSGHGVATQFLAAPPPGTLGVADLLEHADWAAGSVAAVGFAHAWDRLPIAARAASATLAAAAGDATALSTTLADVAALTTFAAGLNRAYERRAPETLAEVWQAMREGDYESEPALGATGSADAVAVLTVHQAKGLEFDTVVLADWVDGTLPDLRTRASLLRPEVLAGGDLRGADAVGELLDEERRIAYVGLTRARYQVAITATQAVSGGRASIPSRFLTELGQGTELADVVTPPSADAGHPLGIEDAAARWRRRFHDTAAPAPERLAALRAVVALGVPPARWWGGLPAVRVDPPVPNRKASFSTLALYEDCPRRFLYDKLLGLGSDAGEAASFGTLVHTLLEHLEDPEADRPDLVEYGRELVEELWDEALFGYRFVARRRWRKVLDLLDTYVRYRGSPAVLRREHWFDFELGEFRVRGKIDRIDRDGADGLRLIDYKTGSAERYDVADDLQLRLYHLAASRDPELRELGTVTSLAYLFPEKTAGVGSSKTLKTLPLEADAELLAATEARVTSLLGRLSRDTAFLPSATADCTYCEYRHLCPRWPEGQPPGVTSQAGQPAHHGVASVRRAEPGAARPVQGTLW